SEGVAQVVGDRQLVLNDRDPARLPLLLSLPLFRHGATVAHGRKPPRPRNGPDALVTGSPQSITTSPPSRPPGIRLSRPNEIRADRHSKRGQAMDTIGEVHGGIATRRS